MPVSNHPLYRLYRVWVWTPFMANKVLDHIFSVTSESFNWTWYVGLHFDDKDLASNSTTYELSLPYYNRPQVSAWEASGNARARRTTVTFWDSNNSPDATVGREVYEGFSGVKFIALWDAATGGNCIAYCPIEGTTDNINGLEGGAGHAIPRGLLQFRSQIYVFMAGDQYLRRDDKHLHQNAPNFYFETRKED